MPSVRKLTNGKDIFKYYAPMMNPYGNGYVVYLFEPSQAWLPDGDSQILKDWVPLSLWT